MHDSQASSRKLEVFLGLHILASKLAVLRAADAPPHRYTMIQLGHVRELHHKFK